jgi:serine/threonine protein kinase
LDLAGVIKVYGIEKYQNTLVIILEDFGGESLKQIMANEPLTVKKFLSLAIQIANSLGNIHAANIIHKDINPSNIVVNVDTKLLKIIDFGIASRLPREKGSLKNPEQLEGTLAYLSPEQTGRINRSMDYRTDLYSLGVTFYELLTGAVPFTATDAMELVHCHLAKTSSFVCEVNPSIPPIVSDIVMKLLAKNAEDRYQSAFGVKADLEKVQKNLTGLEDLSGLQFELAQNDFSGKFEIPQKLYGRQHEINTLLQAFERVSQGSAEMMLVAGYSGVGKTALVHEVHKPMTEKRGYFAAGKFDQFQKNIPYSAITQAFNEFCRYLLMENTETLVSWKTKILAAVGNNGQIIIDVIPDFKPIILSALFSPTSTST